MFSVMWSEHCSYKSCRPLLAHAADARPRTSSPGPGENAGRHRDRRRPGGRVQDRVPQPPVSAVEPYQGAATGVGGILRDIFTMGARPIAVLDALRFGDPGGRADPPPRRRRRPRRRRLRQLRRRARRSAASSSSTRRYQGNPLVNVMAIGLLEDAMLIARRGARARATSSSCSARPPGRDGIGGASVLASATFGEHDPSKRPTRPGRRPVRGEAAHRGHASSSSSAGLVVGLQDLGAAGITCATSRDGGPGGHGHPRRPRRDPAARARHGAVRGHDLRVARNGCSPSSSRTLGRPCGRSASAGACRSRSSAGSPTTATSRVVEGGLDADGRPIPAPASSPGSRPRSLTSEAIVHDRVRGAAGPSPRGPRAGRSAERRGPAAGARHGPGRRAAGAARQPQPVAAGAGSTSSTTTRPGRHGRRPAAGAAVLRVKGTPQALVGTTDGNAAVSALDPWLGAAMSVAEAPATCRSPAPGRSASPTA